MTAERWVYDPKTALTYLDGLAVGVGQQGLVHWLNANNVIPLSAVRGMVVDTLHVVDDRANGWSKAAREAVHEAMGLLLRRLGEGGKVE